MKRLVFVLALLVGGLAATSFSGPSQVSALQNWPPLLHCPNVDGSNDGYVALNDIFEVAFRFGATYPDDAYVLLYDVNGGGTIDLLGDVFDVADAFGDTCPLVETQVAQTTVAMMKYRDWSAAQADGYAVNTQYVPQMGIHVSNSVYNPEFDHLNPIGLIYTETEPGSGVPDQLIGLWHVVPIPEVCAVFGIDPATCSSEEPEGYDGPEDNTDLNPIQRTWHYHTNLCIGPGWVIEQGPTGSAEQCTAIGGYLNFGTYGWMSHMYNFIPNPAGRFLMWNNNLP